MYKTCHLILFIILILIVVGIIYLVYNQQNNTNSTNGMELFNGDNGRKVYNSQKAFVGAWASDVECGQGLKYVSLASALPQTWPN